MSYRRRRGMGVMDYYGLLAQADLQNCSPMDSACVSNNDAKQAAVEDLWARYQSTGVPDDTKLTFTPQTAAEVKEFYNPQDLANSGNVVDTRGILSVGGSIVNAPPPPPSIVATTAYKATVPPATSGGGTTPQGQTIINSSGAVQPTGGAPTSPFANFSFSSVPWYLYAGGAGLLLFAMKGKG